MLTGLKPQSVYFVAVMAVNKYGKSVSTGEVKFVTPPLGKERRQNYIGLNYVKHSFLCSSFGLRLMCFQYRLVKKDYIIDVVQNKHNFLI